ncbi:MAG: 1-acyl-sn-glycerol-3-phosphate acyltransferase [Calditrichaceae bacterium]
MKTGLNFQLNKQKIINIALSIPVFGLLYFFTAGLVLLVLFFSFIHNKQIARKITHFWASGIFVILGRKLHVTGYENIEKEKRYILLVNHCSIYDIPAVMSFYPDVAWFGREYLLKIPLFGRLLKVMDYVPMREGGIGNTKRMLNKLVQNSGKYTIANEIIKQVKSQMESALGDSYPYHSSDIIFPQIS